MDMLIVLATMPVSRGSLRVNRVLINNAKQEKASNIS